MGFVLGGCGSVLPSSDCGSFRADARMEDADRHWREARSDPLALCVPSLWPSAGVGLVVLGSA